MSFCYFNFPYINGICLFLFIPAARPQGIIMSGLNYRNHILWSLPSDWSLAPRECLACSKHSITVD